MCVSVCAHVSAGAAVWDGAYVLAAYLDSQPPGTFAGLRCVELGCGCGLLGLVLARLGAGAVYLTDKQQHLVGPRVNAAKNKLLAPAAPAVPAAAGCRPRRHLRASEPAGTPWDSTGSSSSICNGGGGCNAALAPRKGVCPPRVRQNAGPGHGRPRHAPGGDCSGEARASGAARGVGRAAAARVYGSGSQEGSQGGRAGGAGNGAGAAAPEGAGRREEAWAGLGRGGMMLDCC